MYADGEAFNGVGVCKLCVCVQQTAREHGSNFLAIVQLFTLAEGPGSNKKHALNTRVVRGVRRNNGLGWTSQQVRRL